MKFETGQKVKCIKTDRLPGNSVKPPLEMGKEYEVKNTCTDSQGHQHLDVGLPSKFNYISSYETKEPLPEGDKIHWCHPSRFELSQG